MELRMVFLLQLVGLMMVRNLLLFIWMLILCMVVNLLKDMVILLMVIMVCVGFSCGVLLNWCMVVLRVMVYFCLWLGSWCCSVGMFDEGIGIGLGQIDIGFGDICVEFMQYFQWCFQIGRCEVIILGEDCVGVFYCVCIGGVVVRYVVVWQCCYDVFSIVVGDEF